MKKGKLSCIIGAYVDDTMLAGGRDLEQESKQMEDKFESSVRNYKDVTFDRIKILEK